MANPDGVYIAYELSSEYATFVSTDSIIFTALQPTQQHALDADPAMKAAFWRYGEPLSTAIERAEREARERREKAATVAPAAEPKAKRTDTAAGS